MEIGGGDTRGFCNDGALEDKSTSACLDGK